MCGSEGRSVELGMAGWMALGMMGNGAERRVPWGLAQERKGGRRVGGEPPPGPVPCTGIYCPPYGCVGQEAVGVEDRVVGDVISAEVEEPCQARDLCTRDRHCPATPRVRAQGPCHGPTVGTHRPSPPAPTAARLWGAARAAPSAAGSQPPSPASSSLPVGRVVGSVQGPPRPQAGGAAGELREAGVRPVNSAGRL